jgi:hypothetical protein
MAASNPICYLPNNTPPALGGAYRRARFRPGATSGITRRIGSAGTLFIRPSWEDTSRSNLAYPAVPKTRFKRPPSFLGDELQSPRAF